MRFLLAVAATLLLFDTVQGNLVVTIQENGLTMRCPHGRQWEKNGVNYTEKASGQNVKLSKLSDTDTGEYTCHDGQDQLSAFVFVRLCQNCVELDPGTVSGIVVGDLVATFLIALAVYCVSSSLHSGEAHQASDRQSLVPINDDNVYQHLGNRPNSEYSKITPRLKV